jgi:hypothetical protein
MRAKFMAVLTKLVRDTRGLHHSSALSDGKEALIH